MDETTCTEETVKIKVEQIDFSDEFVNNSDKELARVQAKLEEITAEERELRTCENAVAQGEIGNNSRKPNAKEPAATNKCEICFRIFKYENGLDMHSCNICKYCGKCFAVRSRLRIHRRSHTGIKPYKCRECDKSFPDKYGLRDHVKIHAVKKQYKCNECGQEFSQYGGLSTHIKYKHVDDNKPHLCHICGERFLFPNNLKRHFQIHSTEKPFQCKICEKSFKDEYYVKQHIFKIHDVNDEKITKYECKTCHRLCRTESSLKKHSCSVCEICGEYFAERYIWRRHVKTHNNSDCEKKPQEKQQ